ncbi:MAG: hypothetical protein A2958_01870 [Candidatus Levybacteria bacterium RIFCSPLOWO2_01_FULL_38_13]|nr:MAG: hypothetical protein A2629_02625 [Candidatus Levybacteria bacterium RIFCSPHIGHO2_01_FULL_41_15]OGH35704.1 MAG: hypothetical protein A2958_01870 [Candidatus Levybacteria bacterium RIFCSPLOWO2_01_FULL_38_13]
MKIAAPMTVKIMIDKRSKDAPFVAYTPELDVASCGPTEDKARQNLHEAIEIVLEEAERKGRLKELLEELGFQKKKGRLIPPRVTFETFLFPKIRLT